MIMSDGRFVCNGQVMQSTGWEDAINQARSAIAKATGK
jgi:hypothetical protein